MSDGSRVQGAMIQDRGSWGLRLGLQAKSQYGFARGSGRLCLVEGCRFYRCLGRKNHASCV